VPIGYANFILACLILALKGLLLPRALPMLAFLCYLAASCVTTSAYLLGWESIQAAWMPTVAVLGVAAAVECTRWVLGLQSDEEKSAVSKWGVLLGMVIVAAAMVNHPIAYPKYPTLVYEIRLYSMLFTIGYLAALLGYCFAVSVGVSRYVWHASILLLRLTTMGALLLVPHEDWFSADLIGGSINLLTLCGWLWLLPRRRTAVQLLPKGVGNLQ